MKEITNFGLQYDMAKDKHELWLTDGKKRIVYDITEELTDQLMKVITMVVENKSKQK